MSSEDDLKCFKTLQNYWRRIGLFPKKIKDFTPFNNLIRSLILISTSSPLWLGTLGYIYVGLKGRAYSSAIFALYAFNYFGTVQLCILIFIWRAKETIEFTNNLGTPKYGKPKNFDRTLELIEKGTVLLRQAVILEEIIITVFGQLRQAFCEEKAILGDDRIVCGLVVPLWYPFKIPHIYWILVIYLVFYLPYLASQACGNVLYIGSVIPILMKIDQLKEFLREIDFEDEISSHKKLKACAKYHSELLELVDQMNNSVGYIMSPVQNVLIIVMVGILEFQAVNEKNVTAACQLILWLMLEFLACYAGQLLENASESVAELVYDLKWYDMHPSVRNSLKTFHMQVQITMHYKMQPLIRMNMEYFYKVMKSSYSFLMFLKNY